MHILKDVFIPIPIPDTGVGDAPDSSNADTTSFIDGLNNILLKYKWILLGVFGLATLSMVGLLIFRFIQLAESGSNPQKREQAIRGILVCGVAIAVLGSFTLVFGLLFHSLD